MLLPDKMIRYKESVISKFVPALTILQNSNLLPEELYRKMDKSFSSNYEFIQTLDALYALGKIKLDEKTGELVCL